MLRSLASDGLVEIGDLGNNGRFAEWDIPLDEAIDRVRRPYVTHFDDEGAWWFACWLHLTEKGRQVAEAIEESAGLGTPPLTAEEIQAEQRRLAAAPSLVDVVAGYVEDLTPISPSESPDWLAQLDSPIGWQLIRPREGGTEQPTRVALYRPRTDGDVGASETVTLYRFTGKPPADVVYDKADCTLRYLNAPLGPVRNVVGRPTTQVLPTPAESGMIAVRSSGSFVFCQDWVWAQYNTYIVGSALPGQGRMLHQSLYVGPGLRDEMAADIAELGDAVLEGFVDAAVRATPD